MAKLLTLISVFILGFSITFSQSFDVMNINTDQYPKIRLEFKVRDANGNEIRSFNPSDFEINEDCPTKTPSFVSCPPPGQSKVSYIFVFDKSGSMTKVVPGTGLTRAQNVINAFEEMLKHMPSRKRWEAAIVSFSDRAKVEQKFTNDLDSLLDAVKETYRRPYGQTDFNAGFLYDVQKNPGALRYAQNAKYKPVILFMSDGQHDFQRNTTPSRTNVWEGKIINEALKLQISTGEQIPATIFALTLGFPMPNYLRNIATSTPDGEAIESSLKKSDISRLIVSIINKAGTLGPPAPCEMTWLSCCDGGDLAVTCKLFAITKNIKYTVPDDLKPFLEIVENDHYFSNVKPGVQQTAKIKVTARNNYVVFNRNNTITISDSKFTIINPNIAGKKLDKDSTLELNLAYTSKDSNYYKANISFNSTACNGNDWYSDAGWYFQRDVYVGGSSLGKRKDVTVTGVICNRTNKAIVVTNIYPKNEDAADFQIIAPKPTFEIPAGSCIPITIAFTPNKEGVRKTTLVTETNHGRLYSKLWGDGSGYPEIAVAPAEEIDYPTANCRALTHDTTITITNTGALALDISTITMSNTSDFEQVSWPALPLTLAPDASEKFVVRFNPKSSGDKNCEMIINSNAKNNPAYKIILKGSREDISFTISESSIDYGELCIDEDASKRLIITNTGSVSATITAADAGGFIVAPNTWTIAPGATATVNVAFTGTTANSYSGTIIFNEEFCDFSKSLTLKAVVANPSITSSAISITSTVGAAATGVVNITNNSTRDLTITKYDNPCDQLQIVSPTLPWNIPAGQTLNVTVKYEPVNDEPLHCSIQLSGNPCDFLDSIRVNGNPDLATANIEIEKHTAYAGFDIQIPIHLRDLKKVKESGATHIDTRISYNEKLLGYLSISNGTVTDHSSYIDITDMALSAMKGDVLAVLTFRTNNGTPTTTPLAISNTVSVGGGVSFTEINGEFTILPSSATIEIGTAEGKTGDIVQIPIKMSDNINLASVHKHILASLIYNYSVLEPIGKTPKGTISKDMRIIELTLPYAPDKNGVLANLQFKVMLGTADRITLILANTKTEEGDVAFKEVNGQFTVTNVCMDKDRNRRLFDPKGKAQAQFISISPNPGNAQTRIRFEAQEEGMHSIELYSNVGVKIAELLSKNLKPGIFEIILDTDKISSGSYYLIYKTPTKLISQPFGILK